MILTQRESLPHNCGTQPRCRAANAKPVAACRQSEQYPSVLHHHYHYYLNCCHSGREEDGTMEDEAAFVKCLLQHQLSHCHGQPAKEPSTQQRCCSSHHLRKSAGDSSQQHTSQRGATVDTRTNKTQSPPPNVLRDATNQPHGTASSVKAPPTRKEVSMPSWKRDLERIFAEVEERSQHPIQVYRMLLYESVRESEFLRKELRRSQAARTESQCTAQRLLAEVKELEHVIRKLTVRSHRDDDAKHTSKELSELHHTVQGKSKEPTEEKSPQTTNKKRAKDLLQVLSEKQESEVRSTAEPATLMAEKHYQREGAAAVNVSPITKREELISAQSSSCDFYLRIPSDRVEKASVPAKTGVSSAKRQPSSRKSEGDNHSSSGSTSSASQYAVPSNYSPSPSPAPVNEATNVPDSVAEDSPAANVGAKVNFVADLVSPIAADGADPHPSLLMPPPSFRAQPSGSASSGRHTGSTSNSGSKAATSRSSPSVQLPPQPHDYSTFMISTFTSGSSPHTQESSGSRSSHPASLKAAEEVVLPADRSFTKVDHEASPPAHAVVEIPVEVPQPLLTNTEDRAHLQPSVVGVKDEASGSATSTTDVTMRRRGDLDTSAASSGPSYIFIPDVGDSQHHDLPVRAPISAGDLLNGSEGSFSLLDAHPRAAPYRVTAARSNSRLRSASTSLRTSSIIGELSFSSTTTSSTISTVDRARR